jgi:hypothetical protein
MEKVAPIVPEVERVLGAAKPVADVLATLDRQYKQQNKPAIYFLGSKQPITPYLDELLRPTAHGLTLRGNSRFREGAHGDAVVLYEAALDLIADDPAQATMKLQTRTNRAAAWRELGLVQRARDELSGLLPEIDRLPPIETTMKGRVRYHLALCQWRLDDRAATQKSARESLAAYDAAPKDAPVDPALRRQSEALLTDLTDSKAPPPIARIDGNAEIEAARVRYRARDAFAKLDLKQASARLLDAILGPTRSTKEVLDALDQEYRQQHKPAVWFRPLNQPIAPELHQLLGPSRPTKEVLDALDAQYRRQHRPAVWFLPLNQPIAPHLDELLGKPSK